MVDSHAIMVDPHTIIENPRYYDQPPRYYWGVSEVCLRRVLVEPQ